MIDACLYELFAGSPAAVGSEEGGCVRPQSATAGWWNEKLRDHFTSGPPIGVYPINVGWVKWGCIDYDDPATSIAHAYNTQRLLQHFGIFAWIEVSRSKGHHLWVFVNEWVPAAVMREALLASQQMLGIPPKEINPKQPELTDGQLGNYVRLPYPYGRPTSEGRRCIVYVTPVDDDHVVAEPIGLQHFVDEAWGWRGSGDELDALSDKYAPPPVPVAVDIDPTMAHKGLQNALHKMGGLATTIWQDGPLEGSDRSGTLMKLAHKLAANKTPLTQTEAFVVLADADARWGKFSDRPDRDEHLSKMLAAAWGNAG